MTWFTAWGRSGLKWVEVTRAANRFETGGNCWGSDRIRNRGYVGLMENLSSGVGCVSVAFRGGVCGVRLRVGVCFCWVRERECEDHQSPKPPETGPEVWVWGLLGV